jgi:hypothetical protein
MYVPDWLFGIELKSCVETQVCHAFQCMTDSCENNNRKHALPPSLKAATGGQERDMPHLVIGCFGYTGHPSEKQYPNHHCVAQVSGSPRI